MRKKNKLLLISTLLISTLSVFATGAVVSYANYQAVEKAKQLAGYEGQLTQYSIFLNAGGNGLWDASGALFYMYYTWDGAENHWTWKAKDETINNATIGSSSYKLEVFVFPLLTSSAKFIFVRMNPNPNRTGAGHEYPRFNETGEEAAEGDGKACWNQTDNISLSYGNPSKYHNYYVITGWNSNGFKRGVVALDRTDNSLSFTTNPY